MSTQVVLHPRNVHQGRYDFNALVQALPELAKVVKANPNGEATIDFSDNTAVLLLNRALLAKYYQVKYWTLPQGYLCPPIPGRADYVHYLADLLANGAAVPRGKAIKLLDIGTGANLIYPIIASQSYNWQVVATDCDAIALKAAATIVAANPPLKTNIRIVAQANPQAIFNGVINKTQRFHLTMCNPPFFSSEAEANAASARKWANLGKTAPLPRNFAGQQHELWCDGGELKFVSQMISESQHYKLQVGWFSSLISQQKHLPALKKLLHAVGAVQTQVITMRQGQKVSRILAWSYLTPGQQRLFT